MAIPSKIETAQAAVALLVSRVSLRESAIDFWRTEAENNVRHCRDVEELYGLLLVKFVSSVIGKSIELADGRHEADGVAVPIGQSIHDMPAHKGRRTRKQKILSATDRNEITGEVSRVLSYREAWNRPLEAADWNLCFSRVQSSDCLDMNRRFSRLENAEQEQLTLERLVQPTCDLETDDSRLELLADMLATTASLIDAATAVDTSRKANSIRAKWMAYLDEICDGTAGTGMDKRESRRQRADFRAYLAIGKSARKQETLRKGDFLPCSEKIGFPFDSLILQ